VKIETIIYLGDKVRIDMATFVVTTFSIGGYDNRVSNEVTWFHNGEVKTTWCFDWRLEKVFT
jgi:hypothetical protein